MRPPVKFKWRGIHHSYLGLWMISFGAFFIYMNNGNGFDSLNTIYNSFIVLGTFLVIDDIIEHKITADTPCRIIWNWITNSMN